MHRIVVLQHSACETLGIIEDIVIEKGLAAHYVRTFEGQPVPHDIDDAVGLIIMGGPMGVYEQDRYPFLGNEMRLIQHALKADKPILGICLGSQLLAAVLGASVTKGSRAEIGWHAVRLLPGADTDDLWEGVNRSFMGFHWHRDIFDLPTGAVPLASSEMTEYQAYRYGHGAYGFLFHMEVTEKIINEMVVMFSDELVENSLSGSIIRAGIRKWLSSLQGVGRTVFQRWVSRIATCAHEGAV